MFSVPVIRQSVYIQAGEQKFLLFFPSYSCGGVRVCLFVRVTRNGVPEVGNIKI